MLSLSGFLINTTALTVVPYSNHTNDFTPPLLNVISPTNSVNINETEIMVKLTAEDDIGWQDLTIKIDNVKLFQVNNTLDLIDTEMLQANETHIALERIINLNNQNNLQENLFTITIRDHNNNSDIFSIIIISDIQKPAITWISPLEGESIYNNTIFVSWQIIDSSSIKFQKLKLNGDTIKVYQGIANEVSDQIFGFSLSLPESNFGSTFYTFELSVTDLSNNTNISSLSFISNKIVKLDTSDETRVQNLQAIFLFIVSLIVLFILFKLLYPRLTGQSVAKYKIKNLLPPPLLELVKNISRSSNTKLLEMTDIFFSLENSWNDIMNLTEADELSKDDLSMKVELYISNLQMEIVNLVGSDFTLFNSCDTIILDWKYSMSIKPVYWEGEIKDPPYDKIAEWLETIDIENQFNNDSLVKDGRKEWAHINNQILSFENLTKDILSRKLKDYKSELMILILKDKKLLDQQEQQLEDILTKWLSQMRI